LFPDVDKLQLKNKLKINDESLMYISTPYIAKIITNIITKHALKYFDDCNAIHIMDATAGVGGNTISFARKFGIVTSIEYNDERYSFLVDNIKAYEFENVKIYNQNCFELFHKINCDIIFVDPPWGGKDYKNNDNITLTLSNVSLENMCMYLLDRPIKMIVLKLPKNYDVCYMYKQLYEYINDNKKHRKIYLYELKKMLIVVIENGYYALPL
jgi:16S rRNA G966 N2-methylase RsmD